MFRPRTILLVEDNPDDIVLVRRAMQKVSPPVELAVAPDGAEALAKLFGDAAAGKPPAPRPPALVLLDLKMPRVNGFEVLRRIRSDDVTRLVPVVIFTSSDEEEDVRNGLEGGANSFVQKPVGAAEFSTAVADLTHYWLRVHQPLTPRREPVGAGLLVA